MSNSHKNAEQDQLIELTPSQQNPAQAKPTDFVVGKTYDSQTPLPGHGNAGDSLAEHRRLMKQVSEEPGYSKPAPIPDANHL
jgi:hypothetical protein